MSKSAGKKPKEKSDKTKADKKVLVVVDNNLERFSLLLL